MKPTVAADRKRGRPLGAVVAGADLRISRHAGDVFSDPDKTIQAKGFIKKPVDLDLLLGLVREHCGPGVMQP